MWGTAADLYRIGSVVLREQDPIETYNRVAEELSDDWWVMPYGHEIGKADDHIHLDLGLPRRSSRARSARTASRRRRPCRASPSRSGAAATAAAGRRRPDEPRAADDRPTTGAAVADAGRAGPIPALRRRSAGGRLCRRAALSSDVVRQPMRMKGPMPASAVRRRACKECNPREEYDDDDRSAPPRRRPRVASRPRPGLAMPVTGMEAEFNVVLDGVEIDPARVLGRPHAPSSTRPCCAASAARSSSPPAAPSTSTAA